MAKKNLKPRRDRVAYSVKKAGLVLRVCETSVYKLISTGALWTVTVSNRQMVPRSALRGFKVARAG